MTKIVQMKWGAWGIAGEEFDDVTHPGLVPFILQQLKLTSLPAPFRGFAPEAVQLGEPRVKAAFVEAVERAVGAGRVHTSRDERLLHAYGKSFRDLWRARRGIVDFAPDGVIYPQSESEVRAILTAADTHGVVVVPFGGGTNITGGVELRDCSAPMVVTIDMRRMDRVLELDPHSGIARIEAGATGPRLEAQLEERGHTLGHFPDSFVYSTLGGWLATRSAGMQSDGYGNAEDMAIALRMVTPTGMIETRAVPHSSAGIDVKRLCIGSEGTLGVITEATMRVRKRPEVQTIHGYLFPNFKAGIAAVHECVVKDCAPIISRLNDAAKTQLSFAYAPRRSGVDALVAKAFNAYLSKVRGLDFSTCCLHLAGFEGSARHVSDRRRKTEAIYRRHGGIGLGTSPGRSFSASKYEYPLLRDWAMDRGLIADASETAVSWSKLEALYQGANRQIADAVRAIGVEPFVSCHLSHAYRDGASLYFTFALPEVPELGIEAYLRAKRAAEDAFLRYGGTLSHHHAVGWEHLPWLEQDVSAHGLYAMRALQRGLDPKGVMNPGKLSAGFGMAAWGLRDAAPAKDVSSELAAE